MLETKTQACAKKFHISLRSSLVNSDLRRRVTNRIPVYQSKEHKSSSSRFAML